MLTGAAPLPHTTDIVPEGMAGGAADDGALSHAQMRLWFLQQQQPNESAYQVFHGVEMRGPLDLEALGAALQDCVDRHESLRTVFVEMDGQPSRRVLAACRAPIAVVREDLGRDARVAFARWQERERHDPLPIAGQPLLRASIYRLDGSRHLLMLRMHHLIIDGWSAGVLLRDLAQLYAARALGRAAPPPNAGRYDELVARERAWLGSPAADEARAFWRDRLSGLPALELPADLPTPAQRSARGDRVLLEIPQDTVEALDRLAAEEGCSRFTVLLCGWAALLHRITGQVDLGIGTFSAGRIDPGDQALFGYLAGTLVLRCELVGDPSFRALLKPHGARLREALRRSRLPYDEVVKLVRGPGAGAAGIDPLIQAAIVYQKAPPGGLEVPGMEWEDVKLCPDGSDPHTAKFDLTLSLETVAAGVTGMISYSTDLFTRDRVERMVDHFLCVLRGVAADPDAALSRIALLPPGERARILRAANDAPRAYPRETLTELFAAQAARRPEATAVTCEGGALSYAELDARAARLAERLRALGVEPGVRVGVCLPRSLELCVALLAVLKAGGAYVPLDPAYPEERLRFMIADAGAGVVITRADLAGILPERVHPLLIEEQEAPRRAGAGAPEARATLDAGATPDSVAYVIYTSGSTGRPKGVKVTHANVARLFRAAEEHFRFGPEDVWTLFHSYAFDFSVWEIWGAWLHGGRLVVVPHADSRNPEAFHALLRRERVTVLNQTPSAFRQLLRADAAAPPGELALRYVIFGGEMLEPTALGPWFERHGDRRPTLVNMYGITETTVHVTFRALRAADAAQPASLIGRPLADLSLYVLDAHGELAPIGVPGELYVGGAGVSLGYLERPELTSERFLPRARLRAFAGAAREDGALPLLYRSGDLARLRADGELEYLGRIDSQVKIRGFRIELGEIEATLAAHEGVREAAVLAREGAEGHRALVGYYVASGRGATAAELRDHLAARLPDYMVPAALVAVDALPLNENGKLDRAALLRVAPSAAAAAPRAAFVPPGTPEEALLAEIWEDVLGAGPVGVHDSFFDLGGDSILSIRVLTRARKAGLDISLQQLFKHPTVHALARLASSGAEAAPRTAPLDLCPEEDRRRLPAGVEDAYPLASLQAGMLFHSSLDEGGGTYHDIFSYRLRGALEVDALRAALDQVVAAHPILRTAFALTGYSRPLQLVHRAASPELLVTDLRGLSTGEQDQAIERWFEEEKRRGFDPLSPPLLRARAHRRGDAEINLSISFHHAILDGWSNALLLAELLRRYAALRDGRPALEVAAPGRSFRDFVALEIATQGSADHRRFWQLKLDELQLLRVPRWPGAAPPADDADGMRTVSIPAGVTAGIRQLARAAGVPLKSALLAAHLRVLSILANQDDSQTGLVTNGRIEDEGGEQVIGLFLNTVPFRMRITDVPWRELARRAFESEQELLPFRRYPVSEIQKMAGGRTFETGFNFVHFHALQQVGAIPGVELADVKVFERHNYTLAVIFSVDPLTRQLTVNMVYDAAALHPAQVAQIADLYRRALGAMAADPEASCLSFAPLSDAERERILRRFSGTEAMARAAASALRAHEVFEAQAARTPDAPAVVCPRGEGGAAGLTALSYRQVNERANQLARRLRALGVGRDTVVGVCLPRAMELPASFLAILKAGGAYLPLDPTYPEDRLAYMLEDARPRVLLTVRGLSGRLVGAVSPRVVLLDDPAEEPADESVDNLTATAEPDDLAYVIYTSGTTGRPRAVLVPHRGLANLAAAQIRAFGVEPRSRVLQFASPGFDASVSEVLMALCAGASLHMAGGVSLAQADIVELLRGRAITHVTLPPSLLAVLPEVELPELAAIISAGEACPPALAARWGRGRRFFNAYGPTEATVCATIAEVSAGDAAEPALSIGAPMPGAEVYILDGRRSPVPIGTPGEIHLGGLGVARGYLGQPELTAERFIENPFGPGRLYRTGDIGRFRPDGRVDFLGRADEQIKLRGFRVEPAEIAAVLKEHPAVQDGVVVAREAPGAGKQLVAYVARRPAEPASGWALWPSTFEFPILDELLHRAMVQDEGRMRGYEEAIRKVVPGRVVVEIGTGPLAALTALCARAGARKVYSIEIDERAHQAARARVEAMGLSGTIELLCGDARSIELPEPADVCVSAIIGSIAGSEGAAVILNGARRLLKPDGVMLPERALTRVAAVSLPDDLERAPAFSDLGRHYAKKIFEHVGRPFDLRLCVGGVTPDRLLSSRGLLEELDFTRHVPERTEHEVSLTIERAGRFDGLLAWLDATLAPGVAFDILDGAHSHLPVFLPAPEAGLRVESGDIIRLRCVRALSEDGLHPDFTLRGAIHRAGGGEVPLSMASRQLEPRYKGSPFHRRLFEREEDLRAFLRSRLPEYMVPAHIVELPELPTTAHGKIDRRALPDPVAQVGKAEAALPQSGLEQEIAGIWREVLQIPEVGVHDNFFDLGGHSLLMMLVLNRLQETRSEPIEMVELFEHPTVSSLAAHLRKRSLGASQAAPRSPAAAQAPGGPTDEEIRRKRLAARDQRRAARLGAEAASRGAKRDE